MLDTNQRNRHIFHLIESAIHDFCKVLGCNYSSNKEAIFVSHENEELFFVFPEFNKGNFTINISCFVYTDLTLSKTTKLNTVYKADEIAEYIYEADSSLWFIDDTRLVMSYVSSSQYSDYTILKSKLLLDMYINVQNARTLKDKLEALLAEMEQVRVN